MGKSTRSKRKQKLKRERQEKFKVKEVKRLTDMLRAAGENVDGTADAIMVDVNTLKSEKATRKAERQKVEADVEMEAKEQAEYHKTTLKNKHGNYPVWMNRRQVKRHKKVLSKSSSEGYTKGRKRKRL